MCLVEEQIQAEHADSSAHADNATLDQASPPALDELHDGHRQQGSRPNERAGVTDEHSDDADYTDRHEPAAAPTHVESRDQPEEQHSHESIGGVLLEVVPDQR